MPCRTSGTDLGGARASPIRGDPYRPPPTASSSADGVATCDIESTVPLYAAGGAVVTVVGGRLRGTGGTAVEAAGDAKVLLSGVQVDGRVSQLGSATVDVHPR